MIRGLTSGLISGLISPLINIVKRWVYNFDGVDDRATLQFRAINPDGDIDIEWTQLGISNSSATPRNIVNQSFSAVIAEREFTLRWNGNSTGLQFSVGGQGVTISIPCTNGTYRVLYAGNSLQVFFNGVLTQSVTFNRGAAREPSAVTNIAARNAAGSFTEFANGAITDLKINGVLWPIADFNQTIQLPSPSGLGPELITQSVLENPAAQGTQWTYLGDGRWQLAGDGGYSALRFVEGAITARGLLVEFEVESITGSLRINPASLAGTNWVGDSIVSSTGLKRCIIFSSTVSSTIDFVRHNGGQVVNCIIKNISFKPLWVASAAELVTNGDFNSGTSGWAAKGPGAIQVINGQCVLTTSSGVNSRFERDLTLEPNKYYLCECDAIGRTGNTVTRLQILRGEAGNWAQTGFAEITGATTSGKLQFIFLAPAADALVQIRGDGVNAGTITVDNISVRKLDSLCNPLTLTNTASTGWQEVQP